MGWGRRRQQASPENRWSLCSHSAAQDTSSKLCRGLVLQRGHTGAQGQMQGRLNAGKEYSSGSAQPGSFLPRRACLEVPALWEPISGFPVPLRGGQSPLLNTHTWTRQPWRFYLQNRKALYSKTSVNRKPRIQTPH